MSLVLDSGGTLKQPGTLLPAGASNSIADYMKKFPYHIKVKLGKVYTPEFKEFHEWCVNNLGIKYKDWHLIGSPGNYTLWLKDTKKSMFLTLKYSESIDTTSGFC